MRIARHGGLLSSQRNVAFQYSGERICPYSKLESLRYVIFYHQPIARDATTEQGKHKNITLHSPVLLHS